MSNNGDDYEDDFDAVESEALEDEQSGDEEWDSYDENADDENLDDDSQDVGDEAPRKKKSGLFNIILIAVAVIAAGGFIYMQMGKGAPAIPAQQAEQNTLPAPVQEAQSEGMLGSPQELAKLQEEMARHSGGQPSAPTAVTPAPQAGSPVSEPVAPAAVEPTAIMPQVSEAPVPALTAPAPAEIVNTPAPPMPATMTTPPASEKPAIAVLDAPPVVVKADETAARMPKAQDIMLKSPAAPDVMPAPAPTASGSADAAELNLRIDTLLTRIASLEAEVSSLKNKKDDDKIDSLKASLDTLEKKIETMPSASVEKAPVKKAAPARAAEPAPPVNADKPVPQILGASDDNATEEQPVRKQAVVKPVKVSAAWTLKGAQPGQAMVSKAGESDIRTVSVGDNLPGIGKITAIEYQSDRWTVIGTQGRINQ